MRTAMCTREAMHLADVTGRETSCNVEPGSISYLEGDALGGVPEAVVDHLSILGHHLVLWGRRDMPRKHEWKMLWQSISRRAHVRGQRGIRRRKHTNLEVHLAAVKADGLHAATGLEEDGAAGGLVDAASLSNKQEPSSALVSSHCINQDNQIEAPWAEAAKTLFTFIPT